MLASLYFRHVLVVIILVCLAMGHVAVEKPTLCMEQTKAKALLHGFVKISSKKLPVMMMTHPSELKLGKWQMFECLYNIVLSTVNAPF